MPPRDDVILVGLFEDDPFGQQLRDALTRSDQPYEWVEAPRAVARGLVRDDTPLPAALIGETLLAPATLETITDALGVRYPPSRSEYEVAIVGAGPAGVAAAVYAASDGLTTVVAERGIPGGQASHTSQIENYFGIDPHGEPMSGARLVRIGGRQAETFGAEILIARGVVRGRTLPDGRHEIVLSTGEHLVASAVVCATGVEWRRLEAEGVDELLGRGVYYGAGRSEASGCRDRRVAIVGGGNSAGQAALSFAASGAHVTMLCRGTTLSDSLSQYLIDRIAANPNIDVRLETAVVRVDGATNLDVVETQTSSGAREQLRAEALFIAIGGEPRTDWAERRGLERDSAGYLLTGPDLTRGEWPLERAPLSLESSVPGFFVAGDVRHGSTKRVAAAVGEGATAVALVHRYLEERELASV